MASARIAVAAVLVLMAGACADVMFPEDSGYADIKLKYGAKGDGVTDDTAAFTQAIRDGAGVLYVPAGTYVVSDELKFWPRRWVIQGQSRDTTMIRLKDSSAGFADGTKPHPLVSMIAPPGGQALEAQHVSMFDITLDAGQGNPGAIALYWACSDQGSLRDVKLVSSDTSGSGHCGLMLAAGPSGGGLVQRLEVAGFDYGIHMAGGLAGVTFEDVTLHGQLKAGIWNLGQHAAVRGLRTASSCPAVQHQNHGALMTLLDAELSEGPAQAAAIEAVASVGVEWYDREKAWLQTEGPALLAMNLRTAGYAVAIRSQVGAASCDVPAGAVEQFISHKPLGQGRPAELLKPRSPPQALAAEASTWVSVADHGARPVRDVVRLADMPDSSGAFQKAMDSGSAVIYVPTGTYCLRKSIVVPPSVRRVIGMESTLRHFAGDSPLFQIASSGENLVMERIVCDTASAAKPWFEHRSSRSLTIRNCIVGEYRSAEGAGELFVEDVLGGPWRLSKGQSMWVRGLSCDVSGRTALVNSGGVAWLLGLAARSDSTALATLSGGVTEVWGGWVTARGSPRDAAFVCEDSSVRLSYVSRYPQAVQVRCLQDRQAHQLRLEDTPQARQCCKVPLYVAGPRGPTSQPATSAPAPSD
jgi:hypothetical protein